MKKYTVFHGFFLLMSCCFIEICAVDWFSLADRPTSFLFAPGIGSCERYIVKYCRNYTASTSELVTCQNNFETINGALCSSCNFAEIVLHKANHPEKPSEPLPHQAGLHPASLASLLYSKIRHAIIDPLEKTKITPQIGKSSVQGQSHNNLTVRKYSINFARINLGQEADVGILSKKYDEHINHFSDSDVVIYGISRGGATGFNFLATEYEKKEIKRVKAVVLEGCFDSIEHVLRERFFILSKIISINDIIQKALKGYNAQGMFPLGNVKNFVETCNKYHIPLLLVTSQKDSVVPYACTYTLYTALKAAGMQDLYLLVLKKSDHPWYMLDNEIDTRTYEAVVHAFYKKYDIAHDPAVAHRGAFLLMQCKASS